MKFVYIYIIKWFSLEIIYQLYGIRNEMVFDPVVEHRWIGLPNLNYVYDNVRNLLKFVFELPNTCQLYEIEWNSFWPYGAKWVDYVKLAQVLFLCS